MSNPYNNEIVFNGQTLMSLKEDTVTPDKVLAGETFHDRSGAPQTGSLITHDVHDGLDSTSASDALSANQGRVLNEKYNTLNSNLTQTQNVQIRNISTVYFAERSGFSAIQNGRLLTIQGYVNITTQIPEGTDFATIGITSTNGSLCAVHLNDHSAFVVMVNNGKLKAGENLPTGYYYIVGSLWIMP